MMIKFTKQVRIEDSMVFEGYYEPGLKLSLEEKQDILEHGIYIYMLLDGQLAGEAYGAMLCDLDEEIEDCAGESPWSIYCYSTTILPPFQRKGWGTILKAFWLGQCREHTDSEWIIGHSTSPIIHSMNERFGAEHTVRHEKWYDTTRVAWFYKLKNK